MVAFRRSQVGFSRRTTFERTPNELANLLVAKRARGEHVFDLTVANPTQAGLPSDRQALTKALGIAPERYEPDCRGSLGARQAVAEYWAGRGIQVSVEHIALSASTSEAYAVLFKLFCDPGDEVLVARPSYPLLDELARYESVRLVDYSLAYDGAWHIDFASVERALSERTRAIIVVSPNNPTGNVLSEAEAMRLSSYGVPLISDEVFGRYGLRPMGARSAGADETDVPSALNYASSFGSGLAIVVDGLSKAAALPQMKVAWMCFAGEPEIVDEALGRLDFVLDSQLSVAGPTQAALSDLLRIGAGRRRFINTRLRANLRVLDECLVGSTASRLHVEAGWYAVLRLPATQTELEWVTQLVQQVGVWVQPGWFYDFATEPHCVLSLLTPEDEFARGVALLLEYVSSHEHASGPEPK